MIILKSSKINYIFKLLIVFLVKQKPCIIYLCSLCSPVVINVWLRYLWLVIPLISKATGNLDRIKYNLTN